MIQLFSLLSKGSCRTWFGLLLVGAVLGGSHLQADDPLATAQFQVTTTEVAPAFKRFGDNISSGLDRSLNSNAGDGFMDSFVYRWTWQVEGGGADAIFNSGRDGGFDYYSTFTDGYWDGATIRVYRVVDATGRELPDADGGKNWSQASHAVLVRTDTVASFQAAQRYLINRDTQDRPHQDWLITGTSCLDVHTTAGQDYYYHLTAMDTSGNVSGRSMETAASVATAMASADGGLDNDEVLFAKSGSDTTAPTAPSNVTATAQPNGTIVLNWTPSPDGDLAGYRVYKYLRTASNRECIILATVATDPWQFVRNGDFIYLEMRTRNPPHAGFYSRRLDQTPTATTIPVPWYSGAWRIYDGENVWSRGDATLERVSHDPDGLGGDFDNGGENYLRMTSLVSGRATLEHASRRSRCDNVGSPANPTTPWYNVFEPGAPYRLSVWLKHEGFASGAQIPVTFAYSGSFSFLTKTWTVTEEWREYTYEFTGPAYTTSGSIRIPQYRFDGPGSLCLDNVRIHRLDPDDPGLGDYDLFPEAKAQLVDYQPGSLRFWSGMDNSGGTRSLEKLTTPTAQSGDDRLQLPEFLELCRELEAVPWLIIHPCFNPSEWSGLIDFLAGDASTPYGAKRIAQRGMATPWTDDFPHLLLEWGNETWSSGNSSFEPQALGHSKLTGVFSEYFFQAAQQNPHFSHEKIKFVLNGRTGSSYGADAKRYCPSASAIDITGYIGGWEEGFQAGGSVINDQGFQDILFYGPRVLHPRTTQQTALREALGALNQDPMGQPYDILVYEGGPGGGKGGSTVTPEERTYTMSMATAITTADVFLENARQGLAWQEFFLFGQGDSRWVSHTPRIYGFHPHPAWLSLQLINRTASGTPIYVSTRHCPTVDLPALDYAAALSNVPAVACHAFRDHNRYSVVVLSRKLDKRTGEPNAVADFGDGYTPVTLTLPFTLNGSSTISLLRVTTDGRFNNNEYILDDPDAPTVLETVAVEPDAYDNATRTMTFDLPPASLYGWVFSNVVTSAPTIPQVTIAKALGQADPTTVMPVRFQILFDQPVTGLTLDDFHFSGSAGVRQALLDGEAGSNGSAYLLTVTEVERLGDIVVDLPAGNAFSIANGLGNAASGYAFLNFDLPAEGGLIVLSPQEDTFTGNAVTTSQGSAPTLKTSSGGLQTWLKFQLPGGAGRLLSSARLELFLESNSPPSLSVNLYAVANDAWSEDTLMNGGAATDNRPPKGSLVTNFTTAGAGAWQTIETLSYVRQEMAGDGLLSCVLENVTTATGYWSAKENTNGHGPRLILEYGPASAPPDRLAIRTAASANGFTIFFPTKPGRQYRLYESTASPNPNHPAWVPAAVPAVIGDGESQAFDLSPPVSGAIYYHIRYEE